MAFFPLRKNKIPTFGGFQIYLLNNHLVLSGEWVKFENVKKNVGKMESLPLLSHSSRSAL